MPALCRTCRRRRLPPLLPARPAPLAAPCPARPQEIAPFEEPKIELEQYPTGPHLASRLLYTVRPRCRRLAAGVRSRMERLQPLLLRYCPVPGLRRMTTSAVFLNT